MTLEQLDVLEERINSLLERLRQLKNENSRLNIQLQEVQAELAVKAEKLAEYSMENQRLKSLEKEREEYQAERNELHQRLQRMLSALEQLEIS